MMNTIKKYCQYDFHPAVDEDDCSYAMRSRSFRSRTRCRSSDGLPEIPGYEKTIELYTYQDRPRMGWEMKLKFHEE